jgi:hypothetical protein
MSKRNFMMHTLELGTFPIVSIGRPGTGKSWILNHYVQWCMEHNIYDEYHMILPAYYIEQNDSYAYLRPLAKKKNSNVFIYEKFSNLYIRTIIEKNRAIQERNRTKDSKEYLPRIFVCIDDCTTQKKALFANPLVIELVTVCRHINISAWFLLHTVKGYVLDATTREQIPFVFLYHIAPPSLKKAYEEYIDDDDFPNFKTFLNYWVTQVKPREYCCMLMDTKYKEYSNLVNEWFPKS